MAEKKLTWQKIFDIERLGLIITRGNHYNVDPKYVYRYEYLGHGSSGYYIPNGVTVIKETTKEKGSDLSPVPEVYFEKTQLTLKGKLIVISGLAAIIYGGALLASYLKLIP